MVFSWLNHKGTARTALVVVGTVVCVELRADLGAIGVLQLGGQRALSPCSSEEQREEEEVAALMKGGHLESYGKRRGGRRPSYIGVQSWESRLEKVIQVGKSQAVGRISGGQAVSFV